MGARYYDAALGRFISADTIIADFSNPQSLNRYSYVYNNPVNSTDPTGHVVSTGDDGGCAICKPQPSTKPNKGSTNTNTPGGSNKPANRATRAEHTRGGGDGGNGGGGVESQGPSSSIFYGAPEDVAEAQRLLDTAKAYGPYTRSLVDTIQASGIRIKVVRYDQNINVSTVGIVPRGQNATIDIDDVLQFSGIDALPPANVMLHEAFDQVAVQVGGVSDARGHILGIVAENVANLERYKGDSTIAPIRGYGRDIQENFSEQISVLRSVTFVYKVGGSAESRVTVFPTTIMNCCFYVTQN